MRASNFARRSIFHREGMKGKSEAILKMHEAFLLIVVMGVVVVMEVVVVVVVVI